MTREEEARKHRRKPKADPAELRPDETRTVELLNAAATQFLSLDGVQADEDLEFMGHIRAAKSIVACRVAARANPEVWGTR